MIVVVGTVSARTEGSTTRASGYAAQVALALAAAGESIEMVSKVGADAAGDAVVAELATAKIGHVALVRDGAQATASERDQPLQMDTGDLQLALRYLTSFDAVLLVDPVDDAAVATVLEACTYVGARLVITRPEGSPSVTAPTPALGENPPPLEVERPAGDPAAVTDLLVALLIPDRESPAA